MRPNRRKIISACNALSLRVISLHVSLIALTNDCIYAAHLRITIPQQTSQPSTCPLSSDFFGGKFLWIYMGSGRSQWYFQGTTC